MQIVLVVRQPQGLARPAHDCEQGHPDQREDDDDDRDDDAHHTPPFSGSAAEASCLPISSLCAASGSISIWPEIARRTRSRNRSAIASIPNGKTSERSCTSMPRVASPSGATTSGAWGGASSGMRRVSTSSLG